MISHTHNVFPLAPFYYHAERSDPKTESVCELVNGRLQRKLGHCCTPHVALCLGGRWLKIKKPLVRCLMGKTQLAQFKWLSSYEEGQILYHTVVKAERAEGAAFPLNVVRCLCFYLESSVCPDNALHTGNASTGSCRTEAVATQRSTFNATQLFSCITHIRVSKKCIFTQCSWTLFPLLTC